MMKMMKIKLNQASHLQLIGLDLVSIIKKSHPPTKKAGIYDYQKN